MKLERGSARQRTKSIMGVTLAGQSGCLPYGRRYAAYGTDQQGIHSRNMMNNPGAPLSGKRKRAQRAISQRRPSLRQCGED
jgi:hypothetical protein